MRNGTRIGFAAAILALIAGLAIAKGKPPKPPPDPVDTGVVYFTLDGVLHEMDPDGSGKTALPDASGAEPSRALHGGERWFLEVQPVAGAAYPSGTPRHEVFAVSQSGKLVQLTDAADVEPANFLRSDGVVILRHAKPRWATDGSVVDGKVSYLAKTWSGGTVTEYGLYVVTFDPDTSLTASGVNLGLTPERVEVEFDLDVTTGTYVASQYDWSPDGESLIYRRNEVVPANLGLWRADNGETGWSATQLITSGGPLYGVHPRWAPDTSNRIVFMTGSGPTDSIEIVDAYDPYDQATIIPAPRNKGRTTKWLLPATWSPSGTHLLYSLVASASGSPEQTADCYRATADGGDRTNLTGDTGGTAVHQGWQADG